VDLTVNPDDAVYRRLAEHLDRLPGGFAPTKRGSEITLLKRLFTAEEADLAVHLTLAREDAATIASRAGIDADGVDARLREMARKGLIFSVYSEGGPTLFQAVPFVVGIWEFQVNNLSSGLIRNLAVYYGSSTDGPEAASGAQMRTIPINRSIDPDRQAMHYEQAHELAAAHARFAVAPCICRAAADVVGKGCAAPREACLVFGDWADYYVRTGRGRAIDASEVHAIIDAADAANLVLQPSNSREAAFLCCCCACCCGVLRSLRGNPRPAEAVASAFTAAYSGDACTGCLVCVARCPMGAMTAGDGMAEFNADRCIGCGLCVTTCPTGAMRLERRHGEGPEVPATMDAAWRAAGRRDRQAP
jgi:ferredoxin